MAGGMCEGEGGDPVVREVDVFLVPHLDSDTRLYLLQYPLRPPWRAYGLEERCQEVRVKPKQKKMEVDLALDTNVSTHDSDAPTHLQISSQTLTSSHLPLSASYAIGILCGDQLHLNPLHAVVQLRPSLKYLDEADSLKSKKVKEVENEEDEAMAAAEGEGEKTEMVALQVNIQRRETEQQEESRLQSHAHLRERDEAEAWVPLEPSGINSTESSEMRKKMAQQAETSIPFTMSQTQYTDALTGGKSSNSSTDLIAATHNIGSAELSLSILESLPLQKRIHAILTQGKTQVFQFERIMRLAPREATELEVLSVLEELAMMVQGCWVAASFLRYRGSSCVVRDYLLLQFTRTREIEHTKLEVLKVPKELLRELVKTVARNKGSGGNRIWEFLEPTDESFMKRHPQIVVSQMRRWAKAEHGLSNAALTLNISSMADLESGQATGLGAGPTAVSSRSGDPRGSGPGRGVSGGIGVGGIGASRGGKGVGEDSAALESGRGGAADGRGVRPAGGNVAMSEATKAALPGALREIFLKHHVLNLQFLCECLRELPIAYSSVAKPSQKAVQAAVAAAQAASAPLVELKAELSKVATCIDSVYCLTTLGSPSLDPFRSLVIALLKAKKKAGLRKVDLMEAAKIALKAEVPNATYLRVVKELCCARGGAWVLKEGDGRPS